MSWRGKIIAVHRASWAEHHGLIDEDGELLVSVHVLHDCDNPPCSNPAHLFPGDDAINHDQSARRGRRCAKLTASSIPDIRSDQRSLQEIADTYGVGKSPIQDIKKLRTWTHVDV